MKTYGLARRLGHVDAGQGDRNGGGSEEGQGGEELHCDGFFLESCSETTDEDRSGCWRKLSVNAGTN